MRCRSGPRPASSVQPNSRGEAVDSAAATRCALASLGDEGSNIAAYFITVDPERDTPEILKDYISSVTTRVRGITGEPEKVEEMARGFGIYFRKQPLDDGDYTMDHTASVILLDSSGAFRKTIAWGEDAESAKTKLRDIAGT